MRPVETCKTLKGKKGKRVYDWCKPVKLQRSKGKQVCDMCKLAKIYENKGKRV